MLGRLIDFALANRFLVAFGAVLLVAAGFYAATHLAIDAVPDVTNVQVQVMTTAPALGPLEVEQAVTVPVEAAMSGMPRVEEIRSISQFGLSVVTIVFEEGTDIYWARQQIGERLTETRDKIPAGVPAPHPGPIATGLGEILQFEVRSKPGFTHSLMALREVLDWQVAPQLRRVQGVIEVNANGGEARTYEVRPDPDKLRSQRVPLSRLLEVLTQSNANEGGGYVLFKSQEQRVIRAEGRLKTLDDVRDIALDSRDGTPVLVRHVADVQFAPVLRQGAVTRDGRGEGVVGIVMLLAGENGREVVGRTKLALDEIRKTLPPGVELDVIYDRNDLVQRTVRTLQRNLLEGGVLVVLVLLALLGSLRAGLIVALAVPISMAGAFVGMWYAGLSGNLMSLGALDFGLIVDGSVVLIENVVRRVAEHRHTHKVDRAPVEVIRDACREVARPVAFGVAIILLVYVPLLTLRGVEGKMFRPMALTVMFALVTSLGLALLLMPVLASVFLRSVSETEPVLVRLVKRVYEPLLDWAMLHPRTVLLYAVAAFAVSLGVASRMGAVFLPTLDEGAIALQAIRLPSVSLETSVSMTSRMERCLLENFPDEVETVISKTGRPEIANDPMMVSMTDIIVMLKPGGGQHRTKDELVAAMKEALERDVPGNGYSFSQPIQLRVAELIAGVKTDLGISLYGDDLLTLKAKAEEIKAVVTAIPGAKDVAVEQTGGLPYLRVILKRDALARHGIDSKAVLDTVAVIGGKDVTDIYEGQRRFPLQVRFPVAVREDLDQLRRLSVADATGRQIPLEQLAEIVMEDGPAQVNRDAGRRRAVITCNVRDRDLASFVAQAQADVDAKVKLPTGYTLGWGGTFKNLEQATARLGVAVPVVLLLIFVLLYSSFGAFRPAALIYLNVPMAATGGVFALALRGMDFSISAGVGFIALFGVAVLNGVVLVSSVTALRLANHPRQTAAREGALQRLRPVLMTALVATLGFLPLALSTGAGAEVQKPLATVVIGGLLTSSLLTLFVVPAIYHWFDAVPEVTVAAG